MDYACRAKAFSRILTRSTETNSTFPGALLHTVFSQIFRVGGVQGFSDAAYGAFKDAPSAYYPTPLFGPM